jgi:nucleoside-diphosphate-sugar epimerase
VAETFALLMERPERLAPFERLHFEGYWDADGAGMVEAIRAAVGDPSVKAKPFPWTLLRLLSPFNRTLKELILMRPLWRVPIRLDNARLVSLLGAEPRTPIESAVRRTLQGIGALA